MEQTKIELNAIELFNEQVVWLNLENKQDSVVTLQNGINVADFEFDGITKWNNLPENLSLAYNNNSLTFKFIGVTMYQPKKVKYQYMLEGCLRPFAICVMRPHGILLNPEYFEGNIRMCLKYASISRSIWHYV